MGTTLVALLVSIGRLSVWRLRAATVACLTFGIVRLVLAPGGTTVEVGASGTLLQLECRQSAIRTVLELPRDGRGAVTVRLWHAGQRLNARGVLLTVSRLPGPVLTHRPMRATGNTYRTPLPQMRPGWWEVAIRVPDGGHFQVIPFLIHRSTGWGIVAAYPLFVPVGSMQLAVTVPLDQGLAAVQFSIGAVGESRVTIHLSSSGRSPPRRLALVVSMLDMPMPSTLATATQTRPAYYRAHLFLSMPGLWRVEVREGRAHADAAFLIGRPNSSAQ